MKQIILTTLFIGLIGWNYAQPPGHTISDDHKEKIKAHKVAFISTELGLSAEEAQVFWPLYNEREKKLDAIREQYRPPKGKKLEDLSDKELLKAVDNRLVARQKELDVEKEYHGKFKEVLSIRQLAKLYHAEEEFKRKLIRMLRQQREGDRPSPPGPPGGIR